MDNSRKYGLWAILTAAAIGLADSLLLLMKEIEAISNPKVFEFCKINDVWDCGVVVSSWQAQAFGFPNPILGILFYELMLVMAIVMLKGYEPEGWQRWTLLAMLGLALIFSYWLLSQSAFVLGVFCIFCVTSTTMCTVIVALLGKMLLRK